MRFLFLAVCFLILIAYIGYAPEGIDRIFSAIPGLNQTHNSPQQLYTNSEKNSSPKSTPIGTHNQEVSIGLELESGETLHINGDIGSLKIREHGIKEKRQGGNPRAKDIFDQEFEIGITLEPGKVVSIDKTGEFRIRDIQDKSDEEAVALHSENALADKTRPAADQNIRKCNRNSEDTAPCEGIRGKTDDMLAEIRGGVMLKPGEKVTFFSSGVVGRQQIREEARNQSKTQQERQQNALPRDGTGDNIFESDLEGGITLGPGDRIVFREDGGITLQQNLRDEPVNEKQSVAKIRPDAAAGIKPGRTGMFVLDANGSPPAGKEDPAGWGPSGQTSTLNDSQSMGGSMTREDILTEETAGGVMLKPGEKVTFFSSGVVSRQKIREEARNQGKTQQERQQNALPRDRTGDNIFESDLEGGITLGPGDRIVFRDDGGITLQQNLQDEVVMTAEYYERADSNQLVFAGHKKAQLPFR